MNSFKLLQLPSIPLEGVVKQLHCAKVIELSMMSSKFKRRLQEFKLKIRSLTWEYPCSIKLSSPNIELKFAPARLWKKRKVNGKQVRVKSDYSNEFNSFLFIYETAKYLQILEDFTIHLQSILKIEKFGLALLDNSCDLSLNEIFVWKYCKAFHTLKLARNREMTPNEITFVLDNIDAKELEIRCRVNNNFQYEKPIKCDVLRVHSLAWMNPKCFQSDRYTQLIIDGALGTHFYYFRAVLNYWLSGGNNKLRNCILGEIVCEPTVLDFSRDLPGVVTRPSVFSYHDLRFRTVCLTETDEKVDVRRKCDGRLATLIWTQYRIELLVWNEQDLKYCEKITKEKLKDLSNF